MKNNSSGLAVAALVLGIVGIFISWIPVIGWICPLLAIIFGFISLKKIKQNPEMEGKTMAIIGVVLGFLGLVIPLFQLIGALAYFGVLSPRNLLPSSRL